MGLGGISIWQLLIILLIVVLLFGTKKLKSLGSDLGGAVKGFKKALDDGDKGEEDKKIKAEDSTAEPQKRTSDDSDQSDRSRDDNG